MEIVIAVIGSGALSAVVSGIFNLVSQHKTKNNAERQALKLIMYDRIKYLGRTHIKDGYISSEDLEDLISMHQCYHDDLGGNGYLDSVMNSVKQLPIKE